MLSTLNVGCLLVALWQAYEARKVSTDLQESSYIFIAMALILMVSFVGIPVIIVAEELPSIKYFISASVIFSICTSILVLIYVSKYRAFKKKKQTARQHSSSSRESTSDCEGINILWSPRDQDLLETENKELKKEIEELKRLLRREERNSALF